MTFSKFPLACMCVLALCLCLFPCSCANTSANDHILRENSTVTITSPSHTTRFVLSVADGQLSYSVTRNETVFLCESPLGLTVDGTAYGELGSIDQLGTVTATHRTDQRRINGKTAVANDPCVQAVIPVDERFTLEARIFDNGVAFRYRLAGDGERTLNSEQTGFRLPEDSRVYAGEAHQYYESTIRFRDPSRPSPGLLGSPVAVRLKDDRYLAVLEGDLKAYPGFKLDWAAKYTYTTAFEAAVHTLTDEILTPWRIVTVADDLNELVNNTILYQVCDDADKELFGDHWVKPGRATWSWITGRNTDRVTPTLMKEYTQYAARLGFEYNIIDEGWINWNDYNNALPSLAAQGEPYEVGQILWTGVNAGASFKGGIRSAEDAYAFIDLLDNYGMAGGKIDFFPTEDAVDMGVDIYRDILSYAAEKKLVINFHGCNKPTGFDATFPNELNREAILGLESTQLYNRVTQSQMFTTQPFVRALAGHADYTPAVDEAFHMAQLVLTDAPMQAIGSDPADILASPALEMIKSVPTVWQDTVVLPPSEITQCAVLARKANSGSWFVGGINNVRDGEDVVLELSRFLGEGTYGYELWIDGENGLEQQTGTVTAQDTLTVPFTKYSGFILRFDRVTLSQYGGEIDPTVPVTVTVHDPDTTLTYTLQNGDKQLAKGTLQSGDSLTLSESCTLTIRITAGQDKGLSTSCRFNRIE